MKLLSYKITDTNTPQIGVLEAQSICNLNTLFGDISLIDVFQMEGYIEKINHYVSETNITKHNINNITPLHVIQNPTSLRDAYAFRQHVETCRKNRGADMLQEFDQFPVFYFSNHNAMYADKQDIDLMADHFNRLDYELEFAIVICKKGKNILSVLKLCNYAHRKPRSLNPNDILINHYFS